MKYQFFNVPVISPELEQKKLNLFCSQHRVVDIDKHLVLQGNINLWAFCISYIDGVVNAPKQGSKKRIDYKEILDEDDFTKYAALRELRKKIAEQHGVPVYVVFTNEQLADMVKQRAVTLNQLKSIEGVGSSRLEKYAEHFVVCLSSLFNEA